MGKRYITPQDVGAVPSSAVGQPGGVAPLDNSPQPKIPSIYLPPQRTTEPYPVASEAEMLALSQADIGDLAIRSDVSRTYVLAAPDPSVLSNWLLQATPTDAVQSVDGRTGVVDLSDRYSQPGHKHGVMDLTATGTKDETTVLHGDNVFRAPAGGSSMATEKVILETTLSKNIANNAYTSPDFNVVKRDTSGFFDPASPSQVAIPAGLGGDYIVSFSVGIKNTQAGTSTTRTNGLRRGRVGLNLVALPQNDDRWDTPGAFSICLYTVITTLSGGDVIRAEAYQNSTFTLSLEPTYCSLSVARLP